MPDDFELQVADVTRQIDEYYQKFLKSQTLVEANNLAEEMPGKDLVMGTCLNVEHCIKDVYKNQPALQLKFAKAVTLKIADYFGDKALLISKYTLTQYLLHIEKYGHKQEQIENDLLIDIFYPFVNTFTQTEYLGYKNHFDAQKYTFPKNDLPYIGLSLAEFETKLLEIKSRGLVEIWHSHLQDVNYASLSRAMKYYLEIGRKYTISSSFSPVIWNILGYLYKRIDELERHNLTLLDIVFSPALERQITDAFQKHSIITGDNRWDGILLLNGKIRRGKVSVIAAAQALKISGLIKLQYSETEIAEVLGNDFKEPVSGSTARKHSRNHDEMVSFVNSILPNKR